jgi:DinB superfamily
MMPDTATALRRQFNETLQQWMSWLDDYSFETLLRKPRPGAWSLGQMYVHLLVSTEHFIRQAKLAAATRDHRDEPMHENARRMFDQNSFPPRILEGPDNDSNTPQPRSKEEIAIRLTRIRDDINGETIAAVLSGSGGKTRHPGLLYFSGPEWLQFAEMHLRHHFLQRQRIEDELIPTSNS